jgi:hypothetical protein
MPKIASVVAVAGEAISGHMDEILGLFKPGAKITVIVRFPGLPDRDLIMSDDELEEVIAACRRRNGTPEG